MTLTSVDVTFRRASQADIPAIARQGRTAFLEAFRQHYSAEELAAYFAQQYGPGVQEAEFDSGEYVTFVGECESTIIGHCKLGPFQLPESSRLALGINRLYVLSLWHGRGVARQLLSLAIDEARQRQAPALYLSCWSENPRARRFYEREGFAVIGTCTFPMGDRLDTDYLMRLALTPKSGQDNRSATG